MSLANSQPSGCRGAGCVHLPRSRVYRNLPMVVSTSSPEMLHRETTSEMPLAFGKYLVRTAAKKKTYLQGHYRHAWEMHKLKAACVYSYCNIKEKSEGSFTDQQFRHISSCCPSLQQGFSLNHSSCPSSASSSREHKEPFFLSFQHGNNTGKSQSSTESGLCGTVNF